MSWFERLTGFQETGYQGTRDRLHVQEVRLHSRINGHSYGIGTLELVSLEELRRRTTDMDGGACLRTSFVQDDVRRLHRQHENAGALFQVASQFNLLEMVSYEVIPEDGVARYEYDPPPRGRPASSRPAPLRCSATISRRWETTTARPVSGSSTAWPTSAASLPH